MTTQTTPALLSSLHRARPGRTAAGGALLSILCLGVALAGGCAASDRTHTRSGLTATYGFRTLSTHLEPSVSVLTASAAAEQALRARGYSIARSEVTEDEAVVIGRPHRGGDYDRAVVESRVTKTGTCIAVRIEPFGNEATSYAIMDALLLRIGR